MYRLLYNTTAAEEGDGNQNPPFEKPWRVLQLFEF